MGNQRYTRGDRKPAREAAAHPLLPMLWNQAVSLYRSGRRGEALEACRQMLALTPKQPEVLGLAGTIALELDDAAGAVAYYEAAVACRPEAAEMHYNLGNALTRLGRTEAALRAYRRAAKHRPDLVPIHNNLGNLLQSLGRWDEAAETYRQALTLAPDAPELHRNLGIVLEESGRLDDAVAAYRRALSLKPGWPAIYLNLATALLRQGEALATVETCDAWLRVQPGELEAIGLKALALDELGDREGAGYLVGLDRFLRVVEIEGPPEGYASLRDFNAALAGEMLHHPTLAVPAATDPHYHGPTFRTTVGLFDQPQGAVAALAAMIKRQIIDYLAGLAQTDPAHPYLAKPPRQWRLIGSATVLDRLGNLGPHRHYSGYVSGVYYVQIPDFVGPPEQERAGWLEVGRPPARFHRTGQPEIRAIEPRESRMILFPSYVYHNTVPFDAAQTRISIAFDAQPL